MMLARSRAGFFPNRTGLPVHNGRSASTVFVSRPARASLVLRPADLLTHLSWAWLRGFDEIRYQTPSLVSYPGIPRTPGLGLSPTGDSRRKGAGRVEGGRGARPTGSRPFPSPRSSNRTCGITASGFPTDFGTRTRTPSSNRPQCVDAQCSEDGLQRELARPARVRCRVTATKEVTDSIVNVAIQT